MGEILGSKGTIIRPSGGTNDSTLLGLPPFVHSLLTVRQGEFYVCRRGPTGLEVVICPNLVGFLYTQLFLTENKFCSRTLYLRIFYFKRVSTLF